tara:strand:- start:8 stop:259 length:252 start_codon:yes stop_codon:yes gene_type:complete
MSDVACPISCVRAACPDPDFIEKNGAWLLTVIGVFIGCVGSVFTYLLKSRCKKISCCGVSCDRDVLALDPKDIKIETAPPPEK